MPLQRLSLLVLALALAAAGCEDTPLLVPTDGEILVTANPASLVADPSGSMKFSTIDAVVLSAGGQVLPGRQVTFTRSAGVLCVVIAECVPGVESPPITLDTDSNGVARVVLGLTQADPVTITVTARSGAKEKAVTVSNEGGAVPQNPEMAITVVGELACEADDTQQCVHDLSVDFQAVELAPGVAPITCYEWALLNVQPVHTPEFDDDLAVFQHTFTAPRAIEVILRVTNNAGNCDEDTNYVGEVTVQRPVNVCDPANDPPTVVIVAADDSVPLTGGSATFNLSATVSDPDGATTFQYSWNCGTGGQASTPTEATTNCTYTSATPSTKTVTLTVFDSVAGAPACAESGTDTQTLTVTP